MSLAATDVALETPTPVTVSSSSAHLGAVHLTL
jgi:hypothetical protein